jgi:glutaredoxin
MSAVIELFGSRWCPPCDKAKKIIQSTDPSSRGVTFRYIDVSKDPSYSERPMPVILLGDRMLEGFDEVALRTALQELYDSVETVPNSTDPVSIPQVTQVARPVETNAASGKIVLAVFVALGFAVYEVWSGD